MATSFQCFAEACPSDAEFFCSCGLIFCQVHQEPHLQTNVTHSSSFLFVKLTNEELEALRLGTSRLANAAAVRISSLLNARLAVTADARSRLATMDAEHCVELQRLTEAKRMLEETFIEVVTRRSMPVHPLTPGFAALLHAKQEQALTTEILDSVLQTTGLMTPAITVELETFCAYSIAATLSEATLVWATESQRDCFTHHWFSTSSRCLQVGADSLLVTGGDTGTLACLVSTTTKELTRLADLRVSRKLHAMAFVNGLPAVIGGTDGLNYLTSVEALHEWQWVKLPKLKEGRWNHAAATLLSATYVFGGLRAPTLGTNSIEKFSDGAWTRLEVGLRAPLHNIGVCAWPNKGVLLIGGELPGGSYRGVVGWTEYSEYDLCKLPGPQGFPQPAWSIGVNEVTGFNTDGELCQVKIQEQSACSVF